MARLAAIENTLFYPTPPDEIKKFASHLRITHRHMRLFDPCMGEALAVKTFAQALQENFSGVYKETIELVGVEIEKLRYEQAVERGLYQALHSPIELVDFHNSPDLVFMNPPYDEVNGKRMEIAWIDRIAKTMRYNTHMILVLPSRFFKGGENHNDLRMCFYRNGLELIVRSGYRYRKDTCELYGGMRFTEKHFHEFKQVFLVVRKGNSSILEEEIPIDGIVGELPYEIELNTGAYHISDWEWDKRGDKFELSARQYQAPESVIEPNNYDKLFGVPASEIPVRPLMSMRPEIVAAVIAGGMFSGIQIGNEIVRGGITVRVERVEREDGETKVTEEYDVMVANLSVLDALTGEIQTWDSDSPDFGARIEEVAKVVMQKLEVENPSRFRPADLAKYREYISDIHGPRAIKGRVNGLFEPQIEKASTILKGWENLKAAILIGEMGVGKTCVSIAAAVGQVRRRKADAQKIMILVPAKNDLKDKWKEEIETSCRDIPHNTFEVETISDVQEAFACRGLTFIVVKETMAKRTSGWKHVSTVHSHFSKRKCFNCGKQVDLVNSVGEIIEREDETRYCPDCHALYKTFVRDRNNNAYSSLARYINDHYNGSYVLIIDEAHQFRAGDSARGYASMSLIRGAWRALIMTGTLYNGYASSIFYTLYRSQGSFRETWAYDSCTEFIRRFGLEKRVTKTVKRAGQYSWSGYNKTTTRSDEIPGIHPAMIAMMLPYTVFMKLDEFGQVIPAQHAHTLFLDLPKDVKEEGAKWLEKVKSQAIDEMKDKESPSMSLMGQFMWANRGTFDVYPMGDSVESKELGSMAFTGRESFKMAPKEEALLRVVLGEKHKGYPTLIFHLQTDRRPIHDRIARQFAEHGAKLVYMPSSVTSRVEFVNNAIKEGADAILCNPNIVREGIDLLQFKTTVWYSVTDDAILVNQANARNHRIGQDVETHVYYLGYNGTYQSDRWVQIAKKVSAMSAMHGDVQQGIAALLGDRNLIATLQETLIKFDKAASDLTLADLPPITDPHVYDVVKADAEEEVENPFADFSYNDIKDAVELVQLSLFG